MIKKHTPKKKSKKFYCCFWNIRKNENFKSKNDLNFLEVLFNYRAVSSFYIIYNFRLFTTNPLSLSAFGIFIF